MISSPDISFRHILRLAWPASVASLITPLLGLIDAIVLGYSSRPLDIGAVGLAASVFSLAYWTFGFLRMSTAGLTAQAIGAAREDAARRLLALSVGVGLLVGAVLITIHAPTSRVLIDFLTSGDAVAPATVSGARDYVAWRIWGAPFVLASYAIFGWLTGRGRTDLLMLIVVAMTLTNMGLDAWFVLGLGMGPTGVAIGTLIAEILGCVLAALAALWMLHRHGGLRAHWGDMDFRHKATLRKLVTVNTDIFIRTLVLVGTFVWFTRAGAQYGDVILSANQVLLQMFLITGLALDGAAIAGETLTGQALGQKERDQREALFGLTVRRTAMVSAIGAAMMSLGYLVLADPLLALAAPDPTIQAAAQAHFGWIIISPLVVAACFQLDGFYIGATRSAALRNSMIVSGLIYFASVQGLTPVLGNHGLWLAFGIFMAARAVTLLLAWPGFRPLIKDGLGD